MRAQFKKVIDGFLIEFEMLFFRFVIPEREEETTSNFYVSHIDVSLPTV